jgi:hypothetical protein
VDAVDVLDRRNRRRRAFNTVEKMNAPQKQILNQSFKRFQRLPEWPVACLVGIRDTSCGQQANDKPPQRIRLSEVNEEVQFTKVLTG